MTAHTNVRLLVLHKVAADAIPKNAPNPFVVGVATLQNPTKLGALVRAAEVFVATSIQAIREAAEPNPWTKSTDEEIAGYLLQKIEEKRATKMGEPKS